MTQLLEKVQCSIYSDNSELAQQNTEESQITSLSSDEDIHEVFNCVYCNCTTAYPLMQCAEGHTICACEGATFKVCPERTKTDDEVGRCGAELIAVGFLWYKYLTQHAIYECPVPSCTGLLQGQDDQKHHILKMHPDEAKDLGILPDQVLDNSLSENDITLLGLPSDLSCPLSPALSTSSSSVSSTSSVITVILKHKEEESRLSSPTKDGNFGSPPSCDPVFADQVVSENAASPLPVLPTSTVSEDSLPSKSVHPEEKVEDEYPKDAESDWPSFQDSRDFGNEDIRNNNKITSILTPPQESQVFFGPSFSQKTQFSDGNKLTEQAVENRLEVDPSDSLQNLDDDGWPALEESIVRDSDEDDMVEITDRSENMFPYYSRQATLPRFYVPKSTNAVPSQPSKFLCPRSALGINRFPSLSRDLQVASSSRSQQLRPWQPPIVLNPNQLDSLDEGDVALCDQNKQEIDADPVNWVENIRERHKSISYEAIYQELLRMRDCGDNDIPHNQYSKTPTKQPYAQNPPKYNTRDN